MSLQQIRSHIESRVYAAFQQLQPPVEVIFSNTYETPPAVPYAVCLISYITTTETVICQTEPAMENLHGNLQISAYAPRGRGMRALEEYATAAMVCMNNLYDRTAAVKVMAGQISGPTPILAGDEPYALVTVSCPFIASVD